MAHKCPHCKAISNHKIDWRQEIGYSQGVGEIRIERCHNCLQWSYGEFATTTANEPLLTQPPTQSDVDDELPDDVKKPLRQAIASLESGSWDASTTMSRRALEEAMIDLGATGANLQKKIDDLATVHKITPDLKDWAHETRLGGNLGAHGSKTKKFADEEDAKEILEFSTWFLRYVYVLPAQLAARRAKVSAPGTSP